MSIKNLSKSEFKKINNTKLKPFFLIPYKTYCIKKALYTYFCTILYTLMIIYDNNLLNRKSPYFIEK